MRMPAFTRTTRFRMSLWYVTFFILLCVLLLGGINLAMHPHDRFSSLEQDDSLSQEEIAEQVRKEGLESLRNYSLIFLGGVLLLGTAGGYFISGRMLKPIDRVSSLAARISSSNLKERINHHGPDDEMKRLADTFDDMLGRLESAFDSKEQFIQNASHELKTPIAIAQTNIEVIEMEEKATVADYKSLMEVIKPSLERMNVLSQNLLLLSGDRQNQVKWSIVDIASLLKEVVTDFGAKAALAEVNLELELVPEGVFLKGEAQYLKQAISNLVDNAIKYNHPGGRVMISAHAKDSQLIIQVHDSGIGISHMDQQHIFDRFYRVEKSRSRAKGGAGLGLAIVKKIVEDHGGTISVESTPNEGSTFQVTLPC